ncbi:MAG: acyl-CoA thioesterase [Casimicrobiaceae bacterium]|nr:acyl-CoA thioesterase [Casimicrobiaceae bacterium]MCX8098976.1 acyl-CoA thioesterase [Casimicrobiaceae bacterium]MDW8311992.1 thioesterase family protein [Burkholderiales bacterium]
MTDRSKRHETFVALTAENAARAALLHESLLSVRWGDLDAFGHLNNTVYFRFMEQARIEWFESIGAAVSLSMADVVPNLVGAECRFLRAVTYPATLRVTVRLGHVTEKVVQLLHEIWNGATLAALGDGRILWISQRAQKSVPVPACVQARLSEGFSPAL